MSAFSLTINGKREQVSGVDVHTTLLAYLRARGLTGTKEGCAEGECGACAVVLVEPDGEGRARFRAVNACLLLLPALADAEVWTVEGIGRVEALHPVQAAMVREGGSQCGYCTPGFVMTLFAHYYEAPRADVTEALSGNLCRCTGYRPIRDAATKLPEPAAQDPFLVRLGRAAPRKGALSYAHDDGEFMRPQSLDEALRMRAHHPDAQLLSGGTDLLVELNQQRARRGRWICLDAVPELRECRDLGGTWAFGAGLSLAALEERLQGRVPLLAQLMPHFASPLIRARATLGGNLATASPIGDAAPVLLALDATLELASMLGARRIELASFFTDYRATVLERDELVRAVHVPVQQPTHARFYKVAKRALDDISCVSGAFALHVEGGVITRARLAFGGVAATPVRAYAAENELVGQPWCEASVQRARHVLRESFTPIGDHRGSAAYRSALITSLLDQFWHEVRP